MQFGGSDISDFYEGLDLYLEKDNNERLERSSDFYEGLDLYLEKDNNERLDRSCFCLSIYTIRSAYCWDATTWALHRFMGHLIN
ncbi:unnamed protein product [Trichobilharzia regenti]|nr:unnamed protein product [Trichobilharzia regenti]